MKPRRDTPLFPGGRAPGDLPPLIRVDLRTLAYFAVVLVLVWLAGWLYLHQASEAAAYAHEIRDLMQEKELLRREIISLRADVAMEGSLRELGLSAEKWGYTLPSATDPRRRLLLSAGPEMAATRWDDAASQGTDSRDLAMSLPIWLRRLLSSLARFGKSPSDRR